ncbi:hypothetical protein [Streptomyces sp. NPDC047841]|uniref:hypothetical protein n=1 Tax=Streptomyces sp. NPDC047841 TaxID=3154708 RepID=UPI003453FE6D
MLGAHGPLSIFLRAARSVLGSLDHRVDEAFEEVPDTPEFLPDRKPTGFETGEPYVDHRIQRAGRQP